MSVFCRDAMGDICYELETAIYGICYGKCSEKEIGPADLEPFPIGEIVRWSYLLCRVRKNALWGVEVLHDGMYILRGPFPI